jgi:hypothetical protein
MRDGVQGRGELVMATADGHAGQPLLQLAGIVGPALGDVASWPRRSSDPGPVSDRESWAWVIRHALCADSRLDADEWFPVSAGAQGARDEAAAAIAVCQACPVRSQCLALSLRHWDVGQHGVWGGLVAAERAILRRRMLAHRQRAAVFHGYHGYHGP